MSSRTRTYMAILFASIAAGLIPACVSLCLERLNPGTITICRYGIATVSLLCFGLLMHQPVSLRKIFFLMPLGALSAINTIIFPISIVYISPAVIQTLYLIIPLFVVLFSWLLFREKLVAKKLIALVVGMSGIGLASLVSAANSFTFSFIGLVYVFIATATYALYVVISKHALSQARILEMLLAMSFANIICQGALMIATQTPLMLTSIDVEVIAPLLVIGVIGTSLFYGLYQLAIQQSTPLAASTIQYIMPFFGAFFSYVIVGSPIHPLMIIGGIIAIISAIYINDIHLLFKELRLSNQRRQINSAGDKPT